MDDELVWYVAYGSNLCADRLQRYLDRCASVSAPARRVATTLPHRLFFAHESSVWTGGTAFVDPAEDRAQQTRAVAWLLHLEQFAGVVAGENGRSSLPIDVTALPAPGGRLQVDDRRYGLVLGCPSPDDRPAYTVTTPEAPLPAVTAPVDRYVDTIVRGLVDVHGLTDGLARAYLAQRGA